MEITRKTRVGEAGRVVVSFDPTQYDRLAAGTVPGYAALEELIALAAATAAPASARVLDLGCGTGAGTLALGRALPGATLVACDPVAPMVAAARARCEAAQVRARFVVGALAEAAAEGPFDLVVCTLVLHFVAPGERAAFLHAIRESLRPAGALLLTVVGRTADPEVQELWRQIRQRYVAAQNVAAEELAARELEMRGKVHPLSVDELQGALTAGGFVGAAPLYQLLAVHTWLARR